MKKQQVFTFYKMARTIKYPDLTFFSRLYDKRIYQKVNQDEVQGEQEKNVLQNIIMESCSLTKRSKRRQMLKSIKNQGTT